MYLTSDVRCPTKMREFTLHHNVHRHLGQSEDWIFWVSTVTRTWNVWCNELSRHFVGYQTSFSSSVDTLILIQSSDSHGWKCSIIYDVFSDILECATSPCSQMCNELPGSFSCSCNQLGYKLDTDQRTCIRELFICFNTY